MSILVTIPLDCVNLNYQDGENEFLNVQLADLGGSYPADSKRAKEGTLVGAPMWASLEVITETP
jgi:hypothetical protein